MSFHFLALQKDKALLQRRRFERREPILGIGDT
jgi:hypothetical protein